MRTISLQSFRNSPPQSRKNDYCGFVYSDDGNTVTVFDHGEEREYQEATAAFIAKLREREEIPMDEPATEEVVDPIESDPIVSIRVSEEDRSVASTEFVLRDETEILRTDRGQFYVASDMLDWIKNYNGATPTAGELVDSIKYLLEFLKNS
jgi:hypothetical protein